MKKFFKYFFFSLIIIVPIGFIIAFSKAWNSPPSITVAGSTAVQPLLTELGNQFNEADVTVQPGGSSFGMRVAAQGTKSLGNVSKNPFKNVQEGNLEINGYNKEIWERNQLKTITFAWDGISIVYKPNSINDPELVINKDNIFTILETFAGLKQHKLIDLFVGAGNDKKITDSNDYIVPYARTGGSSASGTATSFLEESGFNNYWNNDENPNAKIIYDILHSGKYGDYTVTTNESNVESWNRFKIENRPSSMIYLSLGFVELNKDLIINQGYKIAKYYNEKKQEIFDANTNNVTNKTYGWYSPLNTIIPIALANDLTKDFVWWLISSNEVNDSIKKEGYSPLSDDDKVKMFLTNDGISINNYKNNKNKFFNAYDTKWNPLEDGKYLHGEWYGVPKE